MDYMEIKEQVVDRRKGENVRPHLMLFVFNLALFGCLMLYMKVRFILILQEKGFVGDFCKCF